MNNQHAGKSWYVIPFLLIVFACLLLPAIMKAQQRQRENETGGPNGLGALHFRFVGPEGNRVSSIIGEPGNPNVVYIGAADGGIWKTSDGGTNWRRFSIRKTSPRSVRSPWLPPRTM